MLKDQGRMRKTAETRKEEIRRNPWKILEGDIM
jgi:hypothetical protein